MRACSARDDRFFRHLPKYRPPPATSRPHTGSTHGRSGTPGAVAAAAQAPQTTNAATLRQHRSHFRRFCCLPGCLISDRRGCRCPRCDHPESVVHDAGIAGAKPARSPSLLRCTRCAAAVLVHVRPAPSSAYLSNRAPAARPCQAPICTLPTATALAGAADAVMTAVEAKTVTAEESGRRWRRRRKS